YFCVYSKGIISVHLRPFFEDLCHSLRFIRFGYDWFERLCKMHNTEIVVLNNIETSPTQEMINDMISTVHVFSYRLYGLRKYKSKLKNDRSLKSGENNDSSSKSKTLSRSDNEEDS
uniref:recombinase family protein n=1 Tax=Ligilactobacillus murinus TaxID=1622 RepID=UPI0039088C19